MTFPQGLHLLPNALTLFRMLSVGPVVYLLLTGRYRAAFVVVLCAGISDLLDGFLARRFGWMTHFGGILDPLADKLMLVTVSITLAWLGYLPAWLVVLMAFRDLLIVAGAWYFHHYVAPITAASPSLLSKWNTLFQILLVVVVMWSLAFGAIDGPWTSGLISIVAATTFLSGAQYVLVWSKRASAVRGGKASLNPTGNTQGEMSCEK